MRCKDCKWWGKPEGLQRLEEDDVSERIGVFSNFAGGDDHRPCGHPKVGCGTYEDAERQGSDGLNCYESVGTGPEFGCIHFEAKK